MRGETVLQRGTRFLMNARDSETIDGIVIDTHRRRWRESLHDAVQKYDGHPTLDFIARDAKVTLKALEEDD